MVSLRNKHESISRLHLRWSPLTSLSVIYVDIAAQKKLKFRDIRNSAEQFGRGLRQHWNWKKGDILALFTPNSADVAAVTFGTLWAGGVLCPLNNLYRVGELVSQLKSSRAKALATNVVCLEIAQQAALIAGIPLDKVFLVDVPDSQGRFKHFSDLQSTSIGIEKALINPKDDLAFLVYSSGTTGLPKGVMLTHSNMVANLIQCSVMEDGNLDFRNDRSIGFLPMFHIYGKPDIIISTLLYQELTLRHRYCCFDSLPYISRNHYLYHATI
jgi:4-coumarate--CoA ligase